MAKTLTKWVSFLLQGKADSNRNRQIINYILRRRKGEFGILSVLKWRSSVQVCGILSRCGREWDEQLFHQWQIDSVTAWAGRRTTTIEYVLTGAPPAASSAVLRVTISQHYSPTTNKKRSILLPQSEFFYQSFNIRLNRCLENMIVPGEYETVLVRRITIKRWKLLTCLVRI
jgi:hypothetical protein